MEHIVVKKQHIPQDTCTVDDRPSNVKVDVNVAVKVVAFVVGLHFATFLATMQTNTHRHTDALQYE